METDEMYMSRCLQLAACGIYGARPNPMVGAVIVAPGGRIIGEGYHAKCGEGHAEVNAFASVRAADEKLLPQSTLYVSLEPCSHYGKTPPCADLVVSKGVARVVVGCVDPFAKVHGAGIKKLREAGIQVTVGVMEEECRELNRRFFTFQTLHRPYIILKWAQSVDGFIDRDFKPTMISTPFTQMLAHKLRSECQAILVGRVTAERDRPRLDVRWLLERPRAAPLRAQRQPRGDHRRASRHLPQGQPAVAPRGGRGRDAPPLHRRGAVGRDKGGDRAMRVWQRDEGRLPAARCAPGRLAHIRRPCHSHVQAGAG